MGTHNTPFIPPLLSPSSKVAYMLTLVALASPGTLGPRRANRPRCQFHTRTRICSAHATLTPARPQFPGKKLFGKMSPSFVRERQELLEEYLKALVKDEAVAREPVTRIFLRLPMNEDEARVIEEAKVGDGLLTGYGGYKSLYQRTREEKARGNHHTQKKELFAGPPTLAGASEVGEAFAKSSVGDKSDTKKWVFRVPLVAQFGGQTVQDVFGGEVKGLHSTYNNQIKKQVEKSSAESDGPVMTADGYSIDDPTVKVAMPKKKKKADLVKPEA